MKSPDATFPEKKKKVQTQASKKKKKKLAIFHNDGEDC